MHTIVDLTSIHTIIKFKKNIETITGFKDLLFITKFVPNYPHAYV